MEGPADDSAFRAVEAAKAHSGVTLNMTYEAGLQALDPRNFSGPMWEQLTGSFRYDATIDLLQPTGSRSYATFRLAGASVMAELQAHDVSRPGERLAIDINMNRASIFDAQTERAI